MQRLAKTAKTQFFGFRRTVERLSKSGGLIYCPCNGCMSVLLLKLVEEGTLRASPKLFKSVTDPELKLRLIQAVCMRAAEESK